MNPELHVIREHTAEEERAGLEVARDSEEGDSSLRSE